jgi:hypothetical protein
MAGWIQGIFTCVQPSHTTECTKPGKALTASNHLLDSMGYDGRTASRGHQMMMMMTMMVVVVIRCLPCSQAHSIQLNHTTPQESMLVNGKRILLYLSMNWFEGGTRNELKICQNYDCLDPSARFSYLNFPRVLARARDKQLSISEVDGMYTQL